MAFIRLLLIASLLLSVSVLSARFSSSSVTISNNDDDDYNNDDDDNVDDDDSPEPEPKVKVLVAVESLCIGCKMFMNEQLYPTFNLLGSGVIDLEVVVFGNSEIDLDAKTVDCQHGNAECDANSYEQCAVSLYPYAYRYLPYLHCLDNDLEMGHRDEPFDVSYFSECARKSALDFDTIQQCHDDPKMAWKLQKEAASKTPSDHEYVPWVVINDEHTFDEEKDDLLTAVCDALIKSGGCHPACPTSTTMSTISKKLKNVMTKFW